MGVGSEADVVGGTDLTRMQRMAAGLLVLASMIYAVSGFYESMRMSVGFIVENTEPARVGAIADWVAVMALFRRPLGLPIPNRGMIPRKMPSQPSMASS